jgi:hypothetical protein
VIASTLGVLVGLAGIEHGFFEMLQGNVTPTSIWIDAIGPSQRFWEYATETAITIIPNFFVTGLLAMIAGLLVTIWAAAFVQRKYGARILFLLSILLWLVGGGYGPIFFTIFAAITATRINKYQVMAMVSHRFSGNFLDGGGNRNLWVSLTVVH